MVRLSMGRNSLSGDEALFKKLNSLLLNAALLCIGAVGCKPDLEGRSSLMDSPRVLAIQSEPAEVAPAGSVSYSALVAVPVDDTSILKLDWALCSLRKPLAESGPIATSCLQPSGDGITDLGSAQQVAATMPNDVCSVFGPNTPTPKPGEPAVRAADPDTTGGYYQPVRLLAQLGQAEGEYEVGVTRLLCDLPVGATPEIFRQFKSEYRANSNPKVDSVTLTSGAANVDVLLTSSASPASVHAGERVEFTAAWAACDAAPNKTACTGAEAYLNFDLSSQALVNRRESIRLSWYATDGEFAHDRTGHVEAEADQHTSSNTWTAPNVRGRVRFWVVVRDDRRGVSWVEFELQVEP